MSQVHSVTYVPVHSPLSEACLPYARASARMNFRVALRQEQAAEVGSGERKAVAAREETPPATQTDVLAGYRERGVILEKTGMPTFVARHLGFQCGGCFQTRREHGAIGELDTDFRAVDGVFIDGEVTHDFPHEFFTDHHLSSFLIPLH